MSNKNRSILVRIAVLVMLAFAVCVISGCSHASETTANETVSETVEEKVEEVKEAAEENAEGVTEVSAETVEETAAAEPTAAPAEPVLLVTLNGERIYSDDSYLNAVISYYNDYAANNGYDTSSAEMISTINQYSLMYTMRSILIRQKATELGLATLTDEEKAETEAKAKAEWAEIIESYVKESGTVTDASTDEEKAAARADAEAVFLSMGYDEARYVNDYMEAEAENKMTARLQDRLTEGKAVTDADVQAYFDDLVREDQETYEGNASTYEFYTQYYGQSSYYVPEGYRAITHILLTVDEELLNAWKDLSARLEEQQSAAEEEPVEETAEATPAPDAESTESATAEPTAEPVTPEMVAAAEKAILDSVQSTIDEIMAKYEGGTSFDDLIKEYGTDTGMKDDAKRAEGYMVHKDSILWDPTFTAAAMALEKVGDISKPVVSQFGVHILQYLKDIPGGAVELTDEMKNQFRETLTDEMKQEALSTALDEWMAASEIVYTEEGESWKLPEEEAEEAAEETAAEEPAAEETANP